MDFAERLGPPPARWIAALTSTFGTFLVASTAFFVAWALARPAHRFLADVLGAAAMFYAVPRFAPLFRHRLTGRDRELLRTGSVLGAGLGLLVAMAAILAVGTMTSDQHVPSPMLWAILWTSVLGTSVVTSYLLASTGPSYRTAA